MVDDVMLMLQEPQFVSQLRTLSVWQPVDVDVPRAPNPNAKPAAPAPPGAGEEGRDGDEVSGAVGAAELRDLVPAFSPTALDTLHTLLQHASQLLAAASVRQNRHAVRSALSQLSKLTKAMAGMGAVAKTGENTEKLREMFEEVKADQAQENSRLRSQLDALEADSEVLRSELNGAKVAIDRDVADLGELKETLGDNSADKELIKLIPDLKSAVEEYAQSVGSIQTLLQTKAARAEFDKVATAVEEMRGHLHVLLASNDAQETAEALAALKRQLRNKVGRWSLGTRWLGT